MVSVFRNATRPAEIVNRKFSLIVRADRRLLFSGEHLRSVPLELNIIDSQMEQFFSQRQVKRRSLVGLSEAAEKSRKKTLWIVNVVAGSEQGERIPKETLEHLKAVFEADLKQFLYHLVPHTEVPMIVHSDFDNFQNFTKFSELHSLTSHEVDI